MKRCSDGKQWKPNDQFPRNRNSKDGRHSHCKVCHNARGRETRQRLYGGSRHYHLKRRYGIGANDVTRMIEAQSGVCAICGRDSPEHVDHDHLTGTVRGILCFNCNGGLGQFSDDIDRLVAAIAYLDSHATDPNAELMELARQRARDLVTAEVGKAGSRLRLQ